jgi:hypothetical protein
MTNFFLFDIKLLTKTIFLFILNDFNLGKFVSQFESKIYSLVNQKIDFSKKKPYNNLANYSKICLNLKLTKQ